MQITSQAATGQVLLTNSAPGFVTASRTGGEGCADAPTGAGTDRDVVVWTPELRPDARIHGPLSVRAVWGGHQSCVIGRRTLCVDEDSYLVVNAGREYAVRADGGRSGESLTVFISDATLRGHAGISVGESYSGEGHELLAEHLRPHGGPVSQYLQRIRDARRRGVTDNDWYSNQIRMLYAQLVESNDELQRRSMVFAPAGASTRMELLRRVMTATDYINSYYMSSITLDDIACAALLSKFHLARLFRSFHGVSPAAYLRAKRIRTAERLIERSDADLADIAERSGFGSRWSMFRALRQRRGMSGQRIRESWSRSLSAVMPAV